MFTDIFQAAAHGTVDDVAYFLDQGVDEDARDEWGNTPLRHSVLHNPSLEVSAFLLNAGADPYIVDNDGLDIWVQAAQMMSTDALQRAFDLHLTENVDFDHILHMSIYLTNFQPIIHILSENGLDLNAPVHDDDGATIFMGLLPYCSPSDVLCLIAHGADVNTKSESGLTPLMCASSCEKWRKDTVLVIKTLLEAGADPNAMTDDGRPVLDFVLEAKAAFSLKCGALTLLRDFGMNSTYTDISLAVGFGTVLDCEYLIHALGTDVDVRDEEGKTLLMTAIICNRSVWMLRALVRAGCDVNARDNFGRTPLMFAATFDSPDTEIVDFLLSHKADVSAVDNYGQSALHYAVNFNASQEVIKSLVNSTLPHDFIFSSCPF